MTVRQEMGMKAIIFDYNGVLADDLELHFEAYLELAKRHKSKATKEDILAILSTAPCSAKIEMIAGTNDPTVTSRLMKEKTGIYIELAKKKGVLFPNERDVLEKLSKKYILAIISNSTREQIIKVFPQDLFEKFSVFLTYEDVEKRKPAPDSLLKVMERLGVARNEACYVGDNTADMAFAKNAGVLAVGITTGYVSREELLREGANLVIGSLSELESCFSQDK